MASFSMSLDGKSMEGTKKLLLKGPLDVDAGTRRSTFNLVTETSVIMRVFSKDNKKTPEKKSPPPSAT